MNVNPYHGQQDLIIDEKLANLHKEMTSLRLECDRLINKHLLVETSLNQDIKNCSICLNPDTSSAYNTGGESCRSNSITPDSQHRNTDYNSAECQKCSISSSTVTLPRSPRLIHRSQNLTSVKEIPTYQEETLSTDYNPNPYRMPISRTSCDLKTPGYSDVSVPCTPKPLRRGGQMSTSTPYRRMGSPVKVPHRKEAADFAKRFRVPAFSIVLRDPANNTRTYKNKGQLYTPNYSEENLPMPKSFRVQKSKEKLYMFDRPIEELPDLSDDGQQPTTSHEAVRDRSKIPEEPVQFKWKVKRRCDGSRYVVKRPIRSQILKKREAQLMRERTGISTDDDAQSELMMGHFYRREERKRHLEKERLRKEMQQQKLMEAAQADKTIVHLSQQKMQKKKDTMLFDGFVTTQEVLSQRNTCTVGKPGILSVTTV